MTWHTTPPEPPPFGTDPVRRTPRAFTPIAWIVIICATVVIVGLQYLPLGAADDDGPLRDDPIGLLLMKLQAQYMTGAAEFQGGGGMFYAYAGDLNAGTIAQRQRFVALAGELAGPGEAARQLAALDDLIVELDAEHEEALLTEEQVQVQAILHAIFPDEDSEDAQIDAVSEDDAAVLVEQLGWFGRLSLAPLGGDDDAREEVLAPARRVFTTMIVIAMVFVAMGCIGFVGLIIVGVLAFIGNIRSGMAPGRGPSGIYAETFAVWLVLFFALQWVCAEIAVATSGPPLLMAAVGFFASLSVLVWPVLRGIPWGDVRQDVGLTLGRNPLVEPFVGVGGYLMTLPLMAVGIALTFLLLVIQTVLSGPIEPLSPTGGPAHPIILEVAQGGWGARLQILLVASVAAPIVEETMFRGVLYRHLREVSRGAGLALSVLASTTLSGFIFAIIHPQGWVAVPALMSLAYGFALAREWRGTLLPSMMMHAISNGLVMSMLFGLLSA